MRKIIKEILHIDDEALCQEIAKVVKIRSYHKNDSIMKIGDLQTEIRFLISGVVRFYYMDEEQTEHTHCFFSTPGDPVMVDAYSTNIMSGCEAVSEVAVLALPMMDGLRLMKSSETLMNVYIQLIRKAMLFHTEVAMVLRACDAKRRYIWFAQNFPEVEACAKSRHIASFLSITPETLSRVRSRRYSDTDYFGQMRLKDDERSFVEIKNKIWTDFPGVLDSQA